MNVNDYLEKQLKNASVYDLSESDKKLVDKGLGEFIMSRFLSKKFRKKKLDPECIDRTRKAIKIQIDNEKPIKVVYFQGGYKLWRLPSSPQADWAEFFNIAYVLNYIAPIAKAYEPGVEITYYCHTLLMERHDNLTTHEINLYMGSLQKLFDEFGKYLPENVSLKILKDADIYERKEYFEVLESGKAEAEEQMKSWPKEKIEDYERMANLNIKWDGAEDWTNLSEEEKQEKIRLAGIYELAATSSLPKVMDTIKAPNLVLIFTKPNPIMIGIGSTYTSIAKHWVGYGILEKHKGSYIPRILSPSQYENVMASDYYTEKVSLFPKMKNFDKIIILNDGLKFN